MALLKFKRSAVPAKIPALNDLALGELAINTYDGKVYTKKDDGTPAIVEIGGNASGITTITSTDGSVTVTGSGATRDLSVVVAGSTTNVLALVRNNTGATLAKGTVVYINGSLGQNSTVAKAIATSDATSAQTLGLMTANLANNATGYVTVIGVLTGMDTSAFTDGQQLYLSPTTAGTFTATKPYAPNHLVYVAVVEHAHPSQGKLFVKVQNGYEMDELHDVSAQNPANNDGLFYNTSTSLWEKKSIATALGYTPASTSGPTFSNGVTVNNGANQVQIAYDGNLEIVRAAGGAYIDFKDSVGEDFDVRLQASGNQLNISASGGLTLNGAGVLTGITSGQVTTALGYTPANKAGDTFTGSVTIPELFVSDNTPTFTSGAFQYHLHQSPHVAYVKQTGGYNWYWRRNSTGTLSGADEVEDMSLTEGGDLLVRSTVRAPLFYDAPNTAYFLDPSATSNIVGLTVANAITGSVTGNAATATKATDLNQARYANTDFNTLGASLGVFGAYTNYIPSGGSYNQPTSSGDFKVIQWGGIDGVAGNWGGQIVQNFYDDRMWFRRSQGTTWQAWREFIHSGNVSTYALPIGGGTVSGAILVGPTGGGAYTRFGQGAGDTTYSTISASNGNLHIDSQAGYDLYLNWYSARPVWSEGVAYFPAYYDKNDTAYYLDPFNTGLSLRVNGNMECYARSAAWAEGYRVRVPARATWGGIRFTRDEGNANGNWAIGYTGIDSTDDLTFWSNSGGAEGMRARLSQAGNLTVYGATTANQSYAQIFYDSNNGAYYIDPESTSNLYRLSSYIAARDANANWNTGFTNTPAYSYNYHGDLNGGTNAPRAGWWFYESMRHSNASNYWGTQIAWGWEDNANELWQRNVSGGGFSGWVRYLNSGNYNSFCNFATNSVYGGIYYDGSDSSTYIDPNGVSWIKGNFNVSRVSPLGDNDCFGGLELREVSLVANTNTAATYSPRVNFHWGAVAAATIFMNSGGNFVFGGQGDITNNRRSIFCNELYATGNVTAYYSDDRLKTRKGNIENALDIVSSLNGFRYVDNDLAKTFGYVNENGQIGVSAQEVQKHLPEIVRPAAFDVDHDNPDQGSKTGENYLTVDYSRLVPLLIEAIKELRGEVEALKNRS